MGVHLRSLAGKGEVGFMHVHAVFGRQHLGDNFMKNVATQTSNDSNLKLRSPWKRSRKPRAVTDDAADRDTR